jgi:uncharacterized membrane protein YgaE (UPF0421/DUF939 family)
MLAARAATAAALAWLAVRPLGGATDDYPYYAPLGAVIATTITVASSLRTLAQTVAAMTCGAALAVGIGQLPMPRVLALALVVGIGTAVAGWSRLGTMGSWVPVSALFILVIGQPDPTEYVVAYLGLTGLGAAVGVAVGMLLPSLGLTALEATEAGLRHTLADQLESLAAALRRPDRLAEVEWRHRQAAVESHQVALREMVMQAAEARRANWRAHRWRSASERQYRRAQALDQLSLMVADLWMQLTDHGPATDPLGVLEQDLHQPASRALDELSAALRERPGSEEIEERLAASAQVVDSLAVAAGRAAAQGRDVLVAGSLVTSLRHAIVAMRPEESRGEPPG